MRSVMRDFDEHAVQSLLKREIQMLERRLEDELEIGRALEKALGCRSSHQISGNRSSIPKSIMDSIKEISMLEEEVAYLERHLLSLYRKAFEEHVCFESSSIDLRSRSPRVLEVQEADLELNNENKAESKFLSLSNMWRDFIHAEKPFDSVVRRCQSSSSQRSIFADGMTSGYPLAEVPRVSHSQPFPTMRSDQNTSKILSLAEHLGDGGSGSYRLPENANELSEEMIKCISTIYCRLSRSSLTKTNPSPQSPPTSTSSSISQDERPSSTKFNLNFQIDSSFDSCIDSPEGVKGKDELTCSYKSMTEVLWLDLDGRRSEDVESLLQFYRLLVSQLEGIEPDKLTREEKIAFWINVHNAMMMHAFLVIGISRNDAKRVLLLLKAAYNVGGQSVSIETIQSSILGCRTSRPRQWTRLFRNLMAKSKGVDAVPTYAIQKPEPLLHFAICSGNHSDAAIRVYTPEKVLQQLKMAKDEYIYSAFRVDGDKVLLPEIVKYFVKDLSRSCSDPPEIMIQNVLPENLPQKRLIGKARKTMKWIPRDLTFRYLISKELAT